MHMDLLTLGWAGAGIPVRWPLLPTSASLLRPSVLLDTWTNLNYTRNS